MKQILTIGLLLSLLTGVPAGQAQPKARKSAIAGKILFESYHAVQNPPVPPIERNIDPKLLKPMPVHIDLVPDSSRTPLPRLKPLQGNFTEPSKRGYWTTIGNSAPRWSSGNRLVRPSDGYGWEIRPPCSGSTAWLPTA